MGDNKPMVSVGMPVYNGEKYLENALDSLLEQDYENFELIISDNASTDSTPEICRAFAAKDGRVRYSRNEMNVGAVKNFNRVFEMSSGKYFMWAGSHDLWHPTMLSRCVSLLEQDESVVVSYPQAVRVDHEGNPINEETDRLDTRGLVAADRCVQTIYNFGSCHAVYGVMRAETLRGIGGFVNVWGPDGLLLTELSLRGTFAQVPEPLFYIRRDKPDEQHRDPEEWKKRVLLALDPVANAKKSEEKSLKQCVYEGRKALLRCVSRSDLSPSDKIKVSAKTLFCFEWHYAPRSPLLFLRRAYGSLIRRVLPRP